MHRIPGAQLHEFFVRMRLATTEHVLRHPNVQRQLFQQSAATSFDLVLVEQFFQEALLAFGRHFDAPLLAIASFEFVQQFGPMFGVFGAWSHVPHDSQLCGERMTFAERAQNARLGLADWYDRHYVYLPAQQALMDRYFAHLKPRATVEQLYHNVSMLLTNGHHPLNTIRPNVPAIVDVGGLHIAAVKPLPANIRRFLDAAAAGAVYVSLGSALRSSDMPAAQLRAFRRTFERFAPVRFVWKLEREEEQTTPADDLLAANVLAQSWLPQNDVLAHRNVRVFITHGGLLGMQEAVQHAVPMLGIPVFADQPQNVARAVREGYAIGLRFENVTEASLSWALEELLVHNADRFAERTQHASRIFRDRREPPLDEAVYWIEYVMRHRGARHLRSAALELSWVQYMLLDVVASAVCGVALVLAVLWLIGKRAVALVWCQMRDQRTEQRTKRTKVQ